MAAEERAGGRQAQPVDLFVDLGLFLDVGVAAGDIRFRLIVVVVGDEILHGVVGKELAKLGVELRRQGLVVGDDERGLLNFLDDAGDGVGLARTGDTEEHLMLEAVLEAGGKLGDRLRLITGRLEFADDLEGLAWNSPG